MDKLKRRRLKRKSSLNMEGNPAEEGAGLSYYSQGLYDYVYLQILPLMYSQAVPEKIFNSDLSHWPPC
jgi:hypothetical protein